MADEPTQVTGRDIPRPVQLEVRQRCVFGFVVCGLPIYEYDHLRDWASSHSHVADDLTLLCDRHHREKTHKLLPLEQVIEANRHPHNRKHGVSKPYDLHYSGNQCEVVI